MTKMWRGKRIGKNWRVYIRYMNKNANVWINDYKHQLVYHYKNLPEHSKNHEALALYNSLDSVKMIKMAIRFKKGKKM